MVTTWNSGLHHAVSGVEVLAAFNKCIAVGKPRLKLRPRASLLRHRGDHRTGLLATQRWQRTMRCSPVKRSGKNTHTPFNPALLTASCMVPR